MFRDLSYHLAKRSFRLFERLGFHITPDHYYSPIPTVSKLRPEIFTKTYDCVGIDWNLSEQRRLLETVFPKYLSEFTPKPNSGLTLVDAFVLYAMIREHKPKTMVEIGAGDTTKISLEALEANKREGYGFRFYSVEPYPRADLKELRRPDFVLIERDAQDVLVETLADADVLFIDSSHVCKIGSDVNYEILELIPRLKKGAIVHWHDITIPKNYWKDWIQTGNMFWNESYVVHAFMLFNNAFKILWAARYLQLNYLEDLRRRFPYLTDAHRMMSFWIERVA